MFWFVLLLPRGENVLYVLTLTVGEILSCAPSTSMLVDWLCLMYYWKYIPDYKLCSCLKSNNLSATRVWYRLISWNMAFLILHRSYLLRCRAPIWCLKEMKLLEVKNTWLLQFLCTQCELPSYSFSTLFKGLSINETYFFDLASLFRPTLSSTISQ